MALQEELIHNKGALLSLVIQDEGRAPCFLCDPILNLLAQSIKPSVGDELRTYFAK